MIAFWLTNPAWYIPTLLAIVVIFFPPWHRRGR